MFTTSKLSKLLYFCDFFAFARLGSSMTGQQYLHLSHGPAPEEISATLEMMVNRGELMMQEVESRSRSGQTKPLSLRECDLSLFVAAEIALVDDVIQSFEKLSLRDLGWRATSDGQTIPYGMVFLANEPVSRVEQVRGRQLMQGRLPLAVERLRNAS